MGLKSRLEVLLHIMVSKQNKRKGRMEQTTLREEKRGASPLVGAIPWR